MADMQDDTEDSRTSLAGRKRAFEENDTDERTYKHARQESSYELSNTANVEQDTPVVAEAAPDDSISHPSPLSGDKLTASTNPQSDAQIATGPSSKPSWNSGAQKGLRTSFASKKARPQQMVLRAESPEVEVVEVAVGQPLESGGSVDEHDGPAIGRSVETTNIEESNSVPASGDDFEQQVLEPTKERKKRQRRKKARQEASEAVDVDEAATSHEPKQKAGGKVPVKEAAPPEDPKAASKKARKAERKDQFKLRRVTESTVAAAAALEKHGWPLPDTHEQMPNILKGRTLYPKQLNPCKYNKSGAYFEMPATLDSRGLPIQFPEISFNEWAIQALIANPTAWSHIPTVPHFLSKAFSVYLNHYYNQSEFAHWTQKIKDLSSPENGAYTVTELIDEAARRVSDQENKKDPKENQSTGEEYSREDNPSNDEDDSTDDDVIMISDDETSESDGPASISGLLEDPNISLTAEQLSLQQKYYPSMKGDTIDTGICLACSQVGHTFLHCPSLLCTSCGGEHSTIRCPERQMCQKCRTRGHTKAECPEKLGVPKSEIQCELCSENSHLGSECHMIWRTYLPTHVRTVQHIPIDCYSCGASNHFGPDCGLRVGHLLTGGLTWSMSNLNRYVDPVSEERALSAGIDYSIQPKKSFSIKGKANDPFVIDDSSDDGQGFIRPKVQTAERGHIRFGERQENRPQHNLPRRPASPVAPYRNPYDGGFGNGEEPRYGAKSDRDYYPDRPSRAPPVDAWSTRHKDKGPPNRGSGGRGRGAPKRGGRGGRGGPRR